MKNKKILTISFLIIFTLLTTIIFVSINYYDFDGDRIPNFIDQDADNDGIPKSIEGTEDLDKDGMPNDLDHDSDGDGLSDTDEYFHLNTHHLQKKSIEDNQIHESLQASINTNLIKIAHADSGDTSLESSSSVIVPETPTSNDVFVEDTISQSDLNIETDETVEIDETNNTETAETPTAKTDEPSLEIKTLTTDTGAIILENIAIESTTESLLDTEEQLLPHIETGADNNEEEDHDGTSADGDEVPDVLEDHAKDYFFNKTKQLFELCHDGNNGDAKCYDSDPLINDGPMIQEFVVNLNNGTNQTPSEIILFSLPNIQSKAYVDYVSENNTIWFAELHRFNINNSPVYLFKHINPYDSQKSHWDFFMNFLVKNDVLYRMTTNGDGWIYGPNGDFSGKNGVIYKQSFSNITLNQQNWKKDIVSYTWHGDYVKPNTIPHTTYTTPSPFFHDGILNMCRTIYNYLVGNIEECKWQEKDFSQLIIENKLSGPYVKENKHLINNVTPYTWMSDNFNILGNQKLKDIVLPGAHDIGAYTLRKETLIDTDKFNGFIEQKYTQSLNIYEQLLMGVRFMDWRLVYLEAQDRFFLMHNWIGPAASAPSQAGDPGMGNLNSAFSDSYTLRQLRAFLDQVKDKHELIIIYLDNPKYIDANKFDRFMEMAKVELGSYLYTVNNGSLNTDLYDKKLSEITRDSSKVFFMLDSGLYSRSTSGFDASFNHPEKGFWRVPVKANYPGTCIVSDVKSTQNDLLSQIATSPNTPTTDGWDKNTPYFLHLNWVRTSQIDLTKCPIPQMVQDMAKDTNSALNTWSKEITKEYFNLVNVFTVDYPEIENTVEVAVQWNILKFTSQQPTPLESNNIFQIVSQKYEDGSKMGLTWYTESVIDTSMEYYAPEAGYAYKNIKKAYVTQQSTDPNISEQYWSIGEKDEDGFYKILNKRYEDENSATYMDLYWNDGYIVTSEANVDGRDEQKWKFIDSAINGYSFLINKKYPGLVADLVWFKNTNTIYMDLQPRVAGKKEQFWKIDILPEKTPAIIDTNKYYNFTTKKYESDSRMGITWYENKKEAYVTKESINPTIQEQSWKFNGPDEDGYYRILNKRYENDNSLTYLDLFWDNGAIGITGKYAEHYEQKWKFVESEILGYYQLVNKRYPGLVADLVWYHNTKDIYLILLEPSEGKEEQMWKLTETQ